MRAESALALAATEIGVGVGAGVSAADKSGEDWEAATGVAATAAGGGATLLKFTVGDRIEEPTWAMRSVTFTNFLH